MSDSTPPPPPPLSLSDECVCGMNCDRADEAHSAADEAWHWPKPSC